MSLAFERPNKRIGTIVQPYDSHFAVKWKAGINTSRDRAVTANPGRWLNRSLFINRIRRPSKSPTLNVAINVMAYMCYKYQGTENLRARICSRYVLSWSGVPAIRWNLGTQTSPICASNLYSHYVTFSTLGKFEDLSLCHILHPGQI
jgi:hypothetical protein